MKRYIITLCVVCLLILPVSAINGDAWAVSMREWDYRIPIIITTAPTDTDVQRAITIIYQEHMQEDFDDVRFYTPSGVQINYWVEEYTISTNAKIWVKLPEADMNYIYVYYGNSAAISIENGENTFIFFDDFNDNILDTDMWSFEGGNFIFNDGILQITDETTILSRESFGTNSVLYVRAKSSDYDTGFASFYIENNYVNLITSDASISSPNKVQINSAVDGVYNPIKNYDSDSIYIYNIYQIARIGSTSITFSQNDVLLDTMTPDVPDCDMKIRIYAWDSSCESTGYYDYIYLYKYNNAASTFSMGIQESYIAPTPTPHPAYAVATLQARPMASATVAPLDDVGYYLLNSALGLNEQYNESAGTGELNPRAVFNASMYPFTGGDYGDYASLLIFAVPFLLAWMRQNSAIIPMSFGCILGTWMLWKLPAEWQMPATGLIILSMMGILYGVYKEKF